MKTANRRENSRQIDSYQQLDRAHRDIETAVDAGLFMGGLNILLLLMLLFTPVYAAKTNWLGIGSISIGIPIIFGCTIEIHRHKSRAAQIIFVYFSINALLWICGVIPIPGNLILLTFIPFSPYLLYGFYKGGCGTQALQQKNLNQSFDTLIDQNSENSVKKSHDIRLQQQLNNARKNIESAVRSGLLMGGLTFILTIAYYSKIDVSRAQLDMTPVIILMDALIIFMCTYRIHENSPSASLWIFGYSIFSLMMKISPTAYDKISAGKFDTLDRFETLFILSLILSTYLFYGFYKGIIGIFTLNKLTQTQLDFYPLWENSNRNRLDTDGHSLLQSEFSSVFVPAEHPEIIIEVERQDRVKQARKNIKIAMIAALVIGVIQLPNFLAIVFNPIYIAKIGLLQFTIRIVNIFSIFGCVYGLYRRNQVAARMMMVYFAVNLVIDICSQNFNIFNIALMSYLFYGAYKGIVGTSILKQSR